MPVLKIVLMLLPVACVVSCGKASDIVDQQAAESPKLHASQIERIPREEVDTSVAPPNEMRRRMDENKAKGAVCANTPPDIRIIRSTDWIFVGHEIGESFDASGFDSEKRCLDEDGCGYLDEHHVRYGYFDYLYSIEARLDEVGTELALPLGLHLGATYQEVFSVVASKGPWLLSSDPKGNTVSLVSDFAIESSTCAVYWVDMQFVDGRLTRLRLNEPSS